MSFSYQKLSPVKVLDPTTDIKSSRHYAVLEGGDKISYKAYTTTSISQSSQQFSTPPPSGGVIVSRAVKYSCPIRITLNGNVNTTNATYTPLTSLLNAGYDAPRAYPLSGSIDTISCTINNTSVSVNLGDVIHPLLHYNIDNKLKTRAYSSTPNYTDQSFNYADLHGAIRSPLAFYSDSIDGSQAQRGGFPFKIVSNPSVIPSPGGTAVTAVIDMLVTEPIFLSPFEWGDDDSQGLYNVNSLDWNISFLNAAWTRMWSHDNLTPVSSDLLGNNVFSNITSGSVQFNAF